VRIGGQRAPQFAAGVIQLVFGIEGMCQKQVGFCQIAHNRIITMDDVDGFLRFHLGKITLRQLFNDGGIIG
jgi:hypothetical protein